MAEPTSSYTSSYTVLRRVIAPDAADAMTDAWMVLGSVAAKSQTDAIKQLANKEQVGDYTAVPARSWSPVRVQPKTVTTFELAEVKAPAAPVTP